MFFSDEKKKNGVTGAIAMSLPSTLKRAVDPLNTMPFCSLTLVIKSRTVSIDGIRMKA